MGTVTATVRELSKLGWTPGKVSTLLRGCVGRSGVSKALKRLKETGSALPKVGALQVEGSGHQNSLKTLGRKSGGIPGKSCGNWLRPLV